MSQLFSPVSIKNITFKNRIVVSPMCQYSAHDGFANDWHLVHLGSRAIGGAALVIVEATAVTPDGRITPQDLGIWKDEHITGLKRITEFLEDYGAVPGIQLAHAGRKASHHTPWDGGQELTAAEGAWQTIAPSAIAYKDGETLPAAMSTNDVRKLVTDFKTAAERALHAGFKVLEIHAAHGYLLHEFLSPLSNKRTDEYGGSFENRIRVLIEVTVAIKSVWPETLPLFVRISASDWVEGGWTVGDSVDLARELKLQGVHLIDCSSGGNAHAAKIKVEPMYQVPFAEKIKNEAEIMTGAVGLITSAQQAEEVIASGKADLVFLARQLLRDPYFPLHAAKELGVDVAWPVQYQRAKI